MEKSTLERVNLVKEAKEECKCPKREPTPGKESWSKIEKTKEAILEHFETSAFNACKHKAIPIIEIGPSLRLHVDEKAKPPDKQVKFHPVPVHLEKEIKEQLDEDVRLGVIEKIAELSQADKGPMKWAARMLTVMKKMGR